MTDYEISTKDALPDEPVGQAKVQRFNFSNKSLCVLSVLCKKNQLHVIFSSRAWSTASIFCGFHHRQKPPGRGTLQ